MDKYARIKQIGEGSFGKALLMKRKDDGKMCVIKEIGISKMSRKEQEDSKKEVKVLSQLKHPNIVTYLESFEGKGNLYIVMDYCDGGDLYQFIKGQRGAPIEENKVLDIFVQCCLAIKYVHDRKILHRDIKTQNIFLMKDNTVKLGDFGIARVLKSTVELAHTCIGTPYYLSPEIVENRPYNNKSDIWSLGCVLYELVTLKHAFEAGNMRNLVLKIVRGSYPPISNRYSFEIRGLVAETFKRSPSSRPSINSILKKPIIQKRIEKFVPQEKSNEEIQDVPIPKPKPRPAAPVSVVEAAKKPIAVKRRDDIANIYGASLAKKPNRRPTNVVNAAIKPKKKPVQLNRKSPSESTKEIAARDRRRKNLVEAEKKHLEQMKKMQQERWQKQNLDQMKMARGAGWRNILGAPAEEVKEKKVEGPSLVDNQQKQSPPVVKEPAKKEEKPAQQVKNFINDPVEQKAPKPVNEKEPSRVPQKPQVNLIGGIQDAEHGKLLEDYWQRKREAEANKMRANQDMYGKVNWKPPAPKKVGGNVMRNKPALVQPARNKQEQEYLRQLEAIRYQNFIERRALNRKDVKAPENNANGDPRFDPEARKKKIQDLRKQAEERRDFLQKKQNNFVKPALQKPQDRLQNNVFLEKNPDERPLPSQNKVKNEMVIPPVGVDTAMGQLQMPKMMRSLSEGDLQEAVNKVSNVRRKNWQAQNSGIDKIALGNLPMEITASAMEATTEDHVEKNRNQEIVDRSDKRKIWVHEGKTQFIENLHNRQINMTIAPTLAFSENTTSEDHLNNMQNENTKTIVVQDQPAATNVCSIKHTAHQPEVSSDNQIISSVSNSSVTNESPVSSSFSSDLPGSKTITISKDTKNDKHATRILPVVQPNTIVSSCPSTDTFIISPRKSNSLQCVDNPIPIKPDIKTIDENTNELSADINQDVEIAEKCSYDNPEIKNDHASKDDNFENGDSSNVSENAVSSASVSSGQDQNSSGTVVLKNVEYCKENYSSVMLENKTSVSNGNEGVIQCIPDVENICLEPDISSGMECIEVPSSNVPSSMGASTNSTEKSISGNIAPAEDNINEEIEHCEDNSLHLPEKKLPLPIKAPVEAWTENAVSLVEENETKQIPTVAPPDDVEEQFFTPSRTQGLVTGVYDTATKLLRTCSLPELNTLPFMTPSDEDIEHNDDSVITPVNLDEKLTLEGNEKIQSTCQEEGSKEEQTELYVEEYDEDEDEDEDDYACMLESMCDLLSNTDEEDNTNDDNDTNDEDSVDWESDEDEVCIQTSKAKELKMKEEQFSRNEESRKMLEDELGLDLFLKVYRRLQALQDDENDELELGTVEISNLLGDKENLYQKILYLVMADSAYCEGNDGLE